MLKNRQKEFNKKLDGGGEIKKTKNEMRANLKTYLFTTTPFQDG